MSVAGGTPTTAGGDDRALTGTSADLASTLREIFRRILDAHLPTYDPWLFRYCGGLADERAARQYLQYRADMLAFGGCGSAVGKQIVEAGWGFGFGLIALRLLGAAQARGVDVYEPMIEAIKAYLPLVSEEFPSRLDAALAGVGDMAYDE